MSDAYRTEQHQALAEKQQVQSDFGLFVPSNFLIHVENKLYLQGNKAKEIKKAKLAGLVVLVGLSWFSWSPKSEHLKKKGLIKRPELVTDFGYIFKVSGMKISFEEFSGN